MKYVLLKTLLTTVEIPNFSRWVLKEDKAVLQAESIRHILVDFMQNLIHTHRTESFSDRGEELAKKLTASIKQDIPNLNKINLFIPYKSDNSSAWASPKDNSVNITNYIFDMYEPFIHGEINVLFVNDFVKTMVHELVHIEQYGRNSFIKRGADHGHGKGFLTNKTTSLWFQNNETNAKYDFHSMQGTELQAMAQEHASELARWFMMLHDLEKFTDIKLHFSKPAFITSVMRSFRDTDFYRKIFRTKNGDAFNPENKEERKAITHFTKSFYKALETIYDGTDTSYHDSAAVEKGLKKRNITQFKAKQKRNQHAVNALLTNLEELPSLQRFRRMLKDNDVLPAFQSYQMEGITITIEDIDQPRFDGGTKIVLPKTAVDEIFNNCIELFHTNVEISELRNKFTHGIIELIKPIIIANQDSFVK